MGSDVTAFVAARSSKLPLTRNALNLMTNSYPSAQNAADVFKDAWFSRLPDVDGVSLKTGKLGLSDDKNVRWANEQVGGFRGMQIIELGPLEGGHSYLLSHVGVEHVLAVEANVLKHFGFTKVEIGCHDKEHINGPAVCLACSK